MKIKRRPAPVYAIPSMAMGDIAFNLLIFFVILAEAQDDSHVKWNPAKAEILENAGRAKVSVIVDVNNKTYLNGQQIGHGQLAEAVQALLGNSPPGDRVVLLKIHNEAPAQQFEPVIEAISEAGGDLVHILEKETK